MSKDGIRSIDVVKSNIDVQSLNNTIVSLRVPLKKTKIRIITKLVHQIRTYRKKTGTEEQIAANKKKCDRLLKEIEEIKKLENDKVLKFALGNTQTLSDVGSQNDLRLKAMVRLAGHKLIASEVEKWRARHPDWPSLAAFLMQHTSRRLKKKKKKAAAEQLAETEGNDEEEGNSIEMKDGDDSSDEDVKLIDHTIPSNKTSPIKGNKTKVKDPSKKKLKSDADNKHSSKKNLKSDETEAFGRNNVDEKEDSNSENGSSDEMSENSEPALQSESLERSDEFVCRGEVVVKRLNLQQEEDEGSLGADTDIQFLFKAGSQESQPVLSPKNSSEDVEAEDRAKRKRDGFFLGNESDSETSSSDNEMADGSTDDEAEERNVDSAKKKMMVESTFLGCLSNSGSKDSRKMSKGRDSSAMRKPYLNSGKLGVKTVSGRRDNRNTLHPSVKTYKKDTVGKPGSGPTSRKGGSFKKESGSQAEKKLHPSWEASLKRKKEQCSLTKFEGKRTTFDD